MLKPKVIFKVGTPVAGNKKSSVRFPTQSRIDYLDQDKAEVVNASIERNKMQQSGDQEKIGKLNIKIYEAEQRMNGPDQEHRFFIEGSMAEKMQEAGYEDMNRDQRLKLLYQQWTDRLEEQGLKGHQIGIRSFVLSPDAKEYNNLSLDSQKEIMRETIIKSMSDFQYRYFGQNDSLTYVYSFHTNTHVPHAHIYLMPFSDNGEYVSLNAGKYSKSRKAISSKSKNEDKLMFLSDRVEKHFDMELNKTQQIAKEFEPITRDLNKSAIGIHSDQKNYDRILER